MTRGRACEELADERADDRTRTGGATASDPTAAAPADHLTIRVSTGAGTGHTRLAAFDAALRAAGVADFNLVQLSSVIPPGSTVIDQSRNDHGQSPRLLGRHGDLLFCVYAEAYATEPGAAAWAGLAWSLRDDGSGAGLFVEHSGPTEAAVRADLRATVTDLGQGRGGRYHHAGTAVSSAECQDLVACAVAVAAYRTAGWGDTHVLQRNGFGPGEQGAGRG